MFGFQRVGDMIWSCADMMCRGFLLGGTAGRTTLNGEGLQHEDGHSHILASTVPNLKSYDPAFGFEITIIVREGLERMYEKQEDLFYYLTLYNENYVQPDMAAVLDQSGLTQDQLVAGVLQGGYIFNRCVASEDAPQVHIFASGPIIQQALEAQKRMVEDMQLNVTLWSITSFVELERQAMACARRNRLHPTDEPQLSYIEQMLAGHSGVFVAATDYMKSLAGRVAPWIPGRYEVLGTDGFGLSESRIRLRDYFEVDATHIVKAALFGLYQEGIIKLQTLERLSDLNEK
jgi:pyruvate dehydrogenase E1 component